MRDNPMKIALVVPGFSAHEIDWCIPALLDYVRVLATQAEVHVFTLRWPERSGSYRVFNASVHALDGREHLGLSVFGLWVRALRAIAAEHRRQPFATIHAFWADEPGWVAALAGRRLGVPVIVSLAGGELIGMRDIGYGAQLLPGRRMLIRWGLRQAVRVTVGSEYLLNLARAHLPQKHWRKLTLAPLGVDTQLFSPTPNPSRTGKMVTIVNVGSLTPVKDQATLLRAVTSIPQAHLRIVGDGPLREELQQLAAELGIANRVEFLGEIDHGQLPSVYRAADIFVQASRHEAQGVAALEAAACGLPVVGTNVGILPEIGRAVPVRDVASLAEVIRRTLNEGGASAREKVEADFSLARAMEKLFALYNGE